MGMGRGTGWGVRAKGLIASGLLAICTTNSAGRASDEPAELPTRSGLTMRFTDESDEEEPPWVTPAAFQPQPLVRPSLEAQPQTALPGEALRISADLFGSSRLPLGTLPDTRRDLAAKPSSDVVLGTDSKIRVSTDTGNLVGKSPSALGTGIQRRSPIVTEPRIRGARVGSLAASGSYWVPARIDLDTMTSKIDSRIISDLVVVNGPFSVLYGPGFSFIDVQLLAAPRYENGFELHGATAFDYKTNGQQVYGRQQILGGGEDYGFRVGYGHRTGNDYRSGNGTDIAASYNSRDVDVAVGWDLDDLTTVEFNYLRLDQTNVEFPGQAFDIDYLFTDGWEMKYVRVDQLYYDRLAVEYWYNRTRLHGDAQNPSKRLQFPFYDLINFEGYTDVHSVSTGMRGAATWGDPDCGAFVLGADVRYIKQELNEITSGRLGFAIWNDANSPIPDSYSANPGLFAEIIRPLSEETTLRLGARADLAHMDVTATPESMANLGLEVPQHSLEQILGTSDLKQNFLLASAYATLQRQWDEAWQTNAGFGYAQRPPNLTEMYAAQPFMFLIQNGLNTVTGDPTLEPEQMWQIEVGANYDDGTLRGGARGFYAWMRDYITFEATRTFVTTQIEQVSLQYVNTELATLAGAEAYGAADLNPWLTPFATMRYVQGTDLTRDGTFATQRATGGNSKTIVDGLPRGWFSGLGGGAHEPLPGILPLEGRVGVWLHEAGDDPRWTIELSARIVNQQNRVATSLGESTTPGFTVWDLRTTWNAYRDFLVVAGIENFTDRNYREHLDFRTPNGYQMFQPGINFYVGTELIY